MPLFPRTSLSRNAIRLLVVSSGFATLSWEVIWQIKSTLALGVSAWGTAITLAVTMGGMSIGGFLMGRVLREGLTVRALALYGALEAVVGLSGLFLGPAFHALEVMDSWTYAALPSCGTFVHILGMVLVIGVPTLCMGATLPVFGVLARQFEVSVAELYGLNTLGAAVGALFVALALIPQMGITHAIWVIAGINFAVGIGAWRLDPGVRIATTPTPVADSIPPAPVSYKEGFIVFVTGFATFTLEIAWFRSMAATYPNSADVFAIMLACMLVALGFAAWIVPKLKRRKKSLGAQLCVGGVLILLVTPLIERLDTLYAPRSSMLVPKSQDNTTWISPASGMLNPDTFALNENATWLYLSKLAWVILVTFILLAPPIRYLGVGFPWVLDDQRTSRAIGRLYALNTFAAIVGAIGTAWILLPTVGYVRAAWIAGALVVVAGVMVTSGAKRIAWAGAGLAALLMAMHFESGIGKVRVQGVFANIEGKPAKVLESYEGPEATASVVEYDDGGRRIIIDSSSAAGQSGSTYSLGEHYMLCMGHLPMLLHPNPKRALVICFGTGQTSNAVRQENPEALDIVDINPRVFKLAHNFTANKDVLHDSKVTPIVMDGRAFLRRTTNLYDVITLEPMPPTDAGVNALYSREFYELARKRLSPNGVIAQWLPFHCVPPLHSASVAKTFLEAFPNAVLWIDPEARNNGILLGTKDDSFEFAKAWPGFARNHIDRNLDQKAVEQSVILNTKELQRYAAYGQVVTDDNQMLSYGKALVCYLGLVRENYELLHRANEKVAVPADPITLFR